MTRWHDYYSGDMKQMFNDLQTEDYERRLKDDEPKPLAAWIGRDGKRYSTNDLSVIARRRAHGHDTWLIEPPAVQD